LLIIQVNFNLTFYLNSYLGDKNLITFGATNTTNRDSAGNNTLNKINSTPQFTIGFNAPYSNQPQQAPEKSNNDNKVTKLLRSFMPYKNTNEDTIEENFTNENESPLKKKRGNSINNNEHVKGIEAKEDHFEVF